MAATEQTAALRTYRGNCHCGAFVYEAELPEIKSGFQCNCSICDKKGYLWAFPGEGKFTIVKGTDDSLTEYQFGPKKLTHKFCPTCATPVMGQFRDGPPGKQRALNIRSIQGISTWDLERVPFDGSALGDKYVEPEYKGSLPAQVEGCKLYTGSCHCGAVGLALMSKPLDETYDDRLVECNCSICERNAYVWAYPKVEQVVLFASDPSNIGRYSFGKRTANKTFCTKCGVPMTSERITQPGEQPTHHPVNLRVFPTVDLTKLKPTRSPGRTSLLPLYVDP
ncbi:hypothetical protein RJ55_08315 [Drechmeria coniospora]|nr:hypothetical protein RJ55_08315 [Drechmeria coniospora]